MTALTTRVTLNLAYILTLGALAALVLNTMLGSLAALAFMACGGLLIVSNVPASIDSLQRWWFVLLRSRRRAQPDSAARLYAV